MNFDTASILALGTTLAIGIWMGYRYATESKKVDAIVAASLADFRAESATTTDWDNEHWWLTTTSPVGGCPCGRDHRGEWLK